jgi:hypothetical protein
MLHDKMNKNHYNVYRKTFGLPYTSALLKYSAADLDTPDG